VHGEGCRVSKFRFEDLEIWKESIDLCENLFDICNGLEKDHLYRFAEQLRGASLSISNNIAEGSGSSSKKDFIQFLNFAHRSCFEVANIIILLNRKDRIPDQTKNAFLERIDILCRKITNFQKALKNP
jgi:four helix bundle protein